MGKNKVLRFSEMEKMPNVIQLPWNELLNTDFMLKNKWNTHFFGNGNPVVLELGCGKGEYTTGLAKLYPNKNFLGIDIKGSRMWVGAKKALKENLYNAGFLRTRIELIASLFGNGEIDGIWITFPDPQPKKKWVKKRLTSAHFLNKYRLFIKNNCPVHLKTDNKLLYQYTFNLLKENNINITYHTEDLHNEKDAPPEAGIMTFYESGFIEKNEKIHLLSFKLETAKEIIELQDDEKET